MAEFDALLPPDHYGELWADTYDEEHSFLIPSEDQLSLLAELTGDGRALELGIGTGRVALLLAARGVTVDGVDASPSMIAQLRVKAGGESLSVHLTNMANPTVAGPYRLIYVVFNTLFCLITQEEQVDCFRHAAALLEPGGVFLLECFVPDLDRFDRGQTLRTLAVGDEQVRIEASRHDPLTQQVVTSVIRIADGGVSMLPVRIRYAWPPELDLMARIAGLQLRQRWGGWNREPFTAASTHHISVYEHAGDAHS